MWRGLRADGSIAKCLHPDGQPPHIADERLREEHSTMFGGEPQGVTKNLAESRNEAKYTAQQFGLRGGA
jgi:hypothetical protein